MKTIRHGRNIMNIFESNINGVSYMSMRGGKGTDYCAVFDPTTEQRELLLSGWDYGKQRLEGKYQDC